MGEVKKLVAFQEDLKQTNLIFERLNMSDKKMIDLEQKFENLMADLAKVHRLLTSNKEWMDKVGKMVEGLMQQQNREQEGGVGGSQGLALNQGHQGYNRQG